MATASGMFARVGGAESGAGAEKRSGTLAQLIVSVCLALLTIAVGSLSTAAAVSPPPAVSVMRPGREPASVAFWRRALLTHPPSFLVDCGLAPRCQPRLRSATCTMTYASGEEAPSYRTTLESLLVGATRPSHQPASNSQPSIVPRYTDVQIPRCAYTAQAPSSETARPPAEDKPRKRL